MPHQPYKGEKKELKIICPFCNAQYSAEMDTDLRASMGCETCGPDEPTGVIEIRCTNCQKIVYKKEIN